VGAGANPDPGDQPSWLRLTRTSTDPPAQEEDQIEEKLFLLAAALLGAAVSAPLKAEQLTQIGVIDISRIISSYFEASYALREIDDMQKKFESDKAQIMAKIQQLEAQQLSAQNAGDDQLALQLGDEIFKQKSYLQEFIRIRTSQIKTKRDTLLQSPTFLSDLVKAIAYVAENHGYSIVLRSDDPNILYWSQEVDITDQVINRLKQIHSSTS